MNLILRLFLKLLEGVNILFKPKKYKIKLPKYYYVEVAGKSIFNYFYGKRFLTCLFTE